MLSRSILSRIYAAVLFCTAFVFGCAKLNLDSLGDSEHSDLNDSKETDKGTDTDDLVTTDEDTSDAEKGCSEENAVQRCGAVDLCVDGYCCNTPCNGECMACNVSGLEGVCTTFAEGEDPKGECGICRVCNGSTTEPKCAAVKYGTDVKNECGLCRFCNGQEDNADCMPAPLGEDPFEDCAEADVATCGASGVCDGLGGCALYSEGTMCKDPVCTDLETASRLYKYHCNGKGECAETDHICGGNFCEVDVNSCQEECAAIEDCAPGFTCADFRCVIDDPKNDGTTCLNNDECKSGVCADYFCCDKACDGDCVACDLPGNEGMCTSVSIHTDPKNDCPTCFACDENQQCTPVPGGEDYKDDCAEDTAKNSCGSSGTCDGKGGCALFGKDRVCNDFSCVDREGAPSEQTVYFCDGRGNCDARVSPCGGFLCEDETACFNSCEKKTQCISESTCEDNRCVLSKPDGDACRDWYECESGNCVDGVCCADKCDGLCERCDMEGMEGRCSPAENNTDLDDDCPVCEVCVDKECAPVENGEDPLNDCTEGMPGECAYTGACDGKGACALRGDTYICGAVCAADQVTTLTCDGKGAGRSHCNQEQYMENCDGNMLCDPAQSACPTECSAAADCAEGFYCETDGTCQQKKGQGDACVRSVSCASRNCVDDVCCGSACNEDCHECAISGSEGTCRPFTAGSDPDDECAECSACDGEGACALLDGADAPLSDCTDRSPCGHTGQCVNGTCAYQPEGLSCGDLLCEGEVDQPTVTLYQCDGEGVCTDIPDRTCGGYRCASESSCLTECEDAVDCAISFSCNDNLCTSNNPDGTPCMLDTECASEYCVDGFCCNSPCDGLCEACDLVENTGTCTPEPSGEWGVNQSTGESDCSVCEVCDGANTCRPVNTVAYPEDSEDPRNLCGDPTAEESCGRTGICENATGVCAVYPDTEICDTSCPSPGAEVFLWHCDGAGDCIVDETPSDCPADLTCLDDESGCRTECLNQTHCTTSTWCTTEGACEPKKTGGEACDAVYECVSGYCPSDDGVCCDDACNGLCESCSLNSSIGLCLPIPNGEDPDGECNDGKFCTQNDSCNGARLCAHEGNPCNETDENDCNDCNETADTCIQPAGSTCGSAVNDDCTHPDTCSAAGVCLANHVTDNTLCDPDADSCTYDVCSLGACTHPDSGNSDSDTICNAMDNCPLVNNENQADSDSDGAGDVCDACPSDPNHTDGPCVAAWMKINVYNNQIEVVFEIYNYEVNPVSMNDLSLRYWYTVDGTFASQSLACYWADNRWSFPNQCSDLVLSPESAVFHAVSRTDANYYMQLSFDTGLTIPAYSGSAPGHTGAMQVAWHTDNFLTFNPSNDYSYSNYAISTETNKVTLYSGSSLIWGTEP